MIPDIVADMSVALLAATPLAVAGWWLTRHWLRLPALPPLASEPLVNHTVDAWLVTVLGDCK